MNHIFWPNHTISQQYKRDYIKDMISIINTKKISIDLIENLVNQIQSEGRSYDQKIDITIGLAYHLWKKKHFEPMLYLLKSIDTSEFQVLLPQFYFILRWMWYFYIQKHEEAIEFFIQSLIKWWKNHQLENKLYYYLWECYNKMWEYSLAVEYYSRFLRWNPWKNDIVKVKFQMIQIFVKQKIKNIEK